MQFFGDPIKFLMLKILLQLIQAYAYRQLVHMRPFLFY